MGVRTRGAVSSKRGPNAMGWLGTAFVTVMYDGDFGDAAAIIGRSAQASLVGPKISRFPPACRPRPRAGWPRTTSCRRSGQKRVSSVRSILFLTRTTATV